MPHEKINFISEVFPEGPAATNQLIVGFNSVGWVQVSIAPFGWKSTGDWRIVDMEPEDIDRAIRALRRAKRVAFPQ